MTEMKPKRKGRGYTPGSGRQKGTPNKVTRELKEMILGALDQVGGQDYLYRCALEEPVAFLTLLGKILPRDVNANVQMSGLAEALKRLREE